MQILICDVMDIFFGKPMKKPVQFRNTPQVLPKVNHTNYISEVYCKEQRFYSVLYNVQP